MRKDIPVQNVIDPVKKVFMDTDANKLVLDTHQVRKAIKIIRIICRANKVHHVLLFKNSGYDSCHFVTGQWECEPGYTGFYCTDPCIKGTFGRRCMGKCTCENNAECHHVTGDCRCPGGWMGKDCTLPCPPGTFGPNCTRQVGIIH